jgi:D-amino-acid dehydrogenase
MQHVLVIGAGIVGLSCASALLDDGRRVTVLDRDPPGDKASFGNAGGVGVSEIVPASVPGLWWRIPGWLIDPLGPLSLRPAHLPALAPFLWRFAKAGRAAEVERITTALASLCARTYEDLTPVVERLGLLSEMHHVGALTVYETNAAFARDRAEWDLKRRHGVVAEVLDGDACRALEPALGPIVRHGILTPGWSHFDDPKRLVDRLRDQLVQRGATFVKAEATAIAESGAVAADGRAIGADAIVVAAGAWSARLAATLGDRAVLESERGYNATLPAPNVALNREVIFGERKFVATPMDMGLRIGGAAEFAGLDAPANHKRSRALVDLARLYLPGLDAAGAVDWMGHRPTTPDSLPVIGRSPSVGNVFYAFGHGHVGLTLGPTTGRLIADVIAGRTPPVDMSPFRIERFR